MSEIELRHNLEQAQQGLVREFQDHQETRRRADSLEKKLIEAVNKIQALEQENDWLERVIDSLNEQLALTRNNW